MILFWFPYSDTIVISNNVVVTLGHVAVALKDSPRTTETILHQCLLQRFCRPPSSLDTLIVDQMGCMLLAKNEVRNQDQTVKVASLFHLQWPIITWLQWSFIMLPLMNEAFVPPLFSLSLTFSFFYSTSLSLLFPSLPCHTILHKMTNSHFACCLHLACAVIFLLLLLFYQVVYHVSDLETTF